MAPPATLLLRVVARYTHGAGRRRGLGSARPRVPRRRLRELALEAGPLGAHVGCLPWPARVGAPRQTAQHAQAPLAPRADRCRARSDDDVDFEPARRRRVSVRTGSIRVVRSGSLAL